MTKMIRILHEIILSENIVFSLQSERTHTDLLRPEF